MMRRAAMGGYATLLWPLYVTGTDRSPWHFSDCSPVSEEKLLRGTIVNRTKYCE